RGCGCADSRGATLGDSGASGGGDSRGTVRVIDPSCGRLRGDGFADGGGTAGVTDGDADGDGDGAGAGLCSPRIEAVRSSVTFGFGAAAALAFVAAGDGA